MPLSIITTTSRLTFSNIKKIKGQINPFLFITSIDGSGNKLTGPINGYYYVTFLTSGNITFSSSGSSLNGNTLLVAGGGGSGGYDGTHDGAGGGAGAVGVGNIIYSSNTKYQIIIGNGGISGKCTTFQNYTYGMVPRSGGNSYIIGGSINENAYGGGFGNPCSYNGGGSGYGGSGGGGNSGWNKNKPGLTGDPGSTILTANGQTWSYPAGPSGNGTLTYMGNRGGYANANLNHGGGGGAGGVGGDGTTTAGGAGGPGYTWLNGSTYGGGGGGAASGYNTNMYGGAGGSGGGAGGSSVTYPDTYSPFNATPNTGGGGGGAHASSPNSTTRSVGGSGICIMAFSSSMYTLQ